jgi:NADH/F420H2 dehydrogenase subunit C
MTNEQLKEKLIIFEPEAVFAETKQYLTINIAREKLFYFAKHLKESEELLFDYLFSLTGIDRQKSFEVVYHLDSSKYKHVLVLKTEIEDRENPSVDSVCNIWRTAEFHEREVFDLFGIRFNNHPDLRRIFLDDDWQGYPLRKNYTDDKIVQR